MLSENELVRKEFLVQNVVKPYGTHFTKMSQMHVLSAILGAVISEMALLLGIAYSKFCNYILRLHCFIILFYNYPHIFNISATKSKITFALVVYNFFNVKSSLVYCSPQSQIVIFIYSKIKCID